MTEAELARAVVQWLQADGWEVFQEVEPARFSHVADIVARRGPLLWVVECKTNFSLKVIEQAMRWIGYAHFVSVAVPRYKGFAKMVCGKFGIGVLWVQPEAIYMPRTPPVTVKVDSAFCRKPVKHWLADSLHEKQKTFAEAGNAACKRWTPFQQTCLALRKIVEAEPGIALKAAIGQLRHHYASSVSARCALTKWIDTGNIKGVRIEREGRAVKLYPTCDSAPAQEGAP